MGVLGRDWLRKISCACLVAGRSAMAVRMGERCEPIREAEEEYMGYRGQDWHRQDEMDWRKEVAWVKGKDTRSLSWSFALASPGLQEAGPAQQASQVGKKGPSRVRLERMRPLARRGAVSFALASPY